MKDYLQKDNKKAPSAVSGTGPEEKALFYKKGFSLLAKCFSLDLSRMGFQDPPSQSDYTG